MKKFLRMAATLAALVLFVSAVAEAQGGGGGGGRGGGQGRGGRGGAGRFTAEGVSADSAYTLMMTGITLDATKKAAVVKLITTFQTDYRAIPAPQGGQRGGAAGGGAAMDSAAQATMMANMQKRNDLVTKFRDEVKKQLTPEQVTTFDANFPPPGARRGGGGGR